mgnify:CR=1 FL=1
MRFLAFILITFSFIYALPEEFDTKRYQVGEKIFEQKCTQCHVKYMDIQLLMKNFIEEDNKLLNLKAPTANEISFRLKHQIGSMDDMEFHLIETAEFMEDYLYYPDKAKTICLEGVVKHFDTMPSLKGKITPQEIEDVAFFIYFLEGFNDVNEFYHDESKF